MKRTLTRISVGAAALALAAGTGAATYATLSDAPQSTVVREVTVTDGTTAVSNGALTIGEVYDRAHASVVEITVTTAASSGPVAPGSGTSQAQGSGFVYDTSGHVITNAHVVDGAQSVEVTLLERQEVRRDDRRDGCVDRSRRPEGGRAGVAPRAAGARRLLRGRGRRHRRRDRQPVRAGELGDGRDRQRARSLDGGAERVHDQRVDPDRRRDQPRQLGRAAARPATAA